MRSYITKAFYALVAMFVAAPAFAAQAAPMDPKGYAYLGAGLAAGLATIGGAYGIGKLATAAMAGTSRQPEAGGAIRTSMIIAAALIEGFTMFAVVVALLLSGK